MVDVRTVWDNRRVIVVILTDGSQFGDRIQYLAIYKQPQIAVKVILDFGMVLDGDHKPSQPQIHKNRVQKSLGAIPEVCIGQKNIFRIRETVFFGKDWFSSERL